VIGREAIVSGIAVELPEVGSFPAEYLLSTAPRLIPKHPLDPVTNLGRGLRFKDRATKLALCAAQTALRDANLPAGPMDQILSTHFGVVVACNTGNLDTVVNTTDQIQQGGVVRTSPIDLPNASSNVIASTLAIRLGCRGPNLTITSGGTAGIDALAYAERLIRSGRSDLILVVGVEVRNAVTASLFVDSISTWLKAVAPLELADGAAAVVLEEKSILASRQRKSYAAFHCFSTSLEIKRSKLEAVFAVSLRPWKWLVPPLAYPEVGTRLANIGSSAIPPENQQDLAPLIGDGFGMLGVLQAAAAAAWLQTAPSNAVVAISAGGQFGGPIGTALMKKVVN
jgi:3-oxoacyl-[acyl-carrier-protein] synthase II